jgi:DNA-binding response OmpR family regulator
MVTVLVAAHDTSLRQAVAAALAARGHETVAVPDLDTARRALLALRADALVLSTDLGLPGLEELLSLVQDEEPTVPALFLATLEERWSPGAVPRRPGRDEVLVRPCAGHQVAQALARLLQKAEGDFLQVGAAHLHRPSRELRGAGGAVMLTATEAQLLEYLARRRGRVVPVGELLEQVWGFPAGQGPAGTVRAHIRNLRAKLRLASGGEVRVRTLHRHGYLLE